MKVRLLKQLRKKYLIEERNGKYKVSHRLLTELLVPYTFQKCRSWSNDLSLCRKYIAWLILSDARARFSVPKRKIK